MATVMFEEIERKGGSDVDRHFFSAPLCGRFLAVIRLRLTVRIKVSI